MGILKVGSRMKLNLKYLEKPIYFLGIEIFYSLKNYPCLKESILGSSQENAASWMKTSKKISHFTRSQTLQ